MTKTYLEKQKKEKQKRMSKGGTITQLMAVTPLMQKKIAQSRTIFGNERLLEKQDVLQLKTSNERNLYLKVEDLKYIKKGSDEIFTKKIDKEFIWNNIVEGRKDKFDYKIVSEEIAKKYLESDENYVDVDYSTSKKEN